MDKTSQDNISKQRRSVGLLMQICAAGGMLATIVIVVAVFVAAAFTPGYSHIANTVSQLGAWQRPHPWIMNSGFILFGILIIGLSFGLYRQTQRRYLSPLLLTGLSVFGLGIILAGIFHDGPKGQDNLESNLHSLFALIAFFGLVAGMIFFALAVRRSSDWHGYMRASIIVVVVDLTFSTLFMLEALSPIEGLLQRLFYAPALGWLFAVSWRLRRLGLAQTTGRG
jgi:hypothetical membrane protein